MQGIIIENISNLYKIEFKNNIYTATARGRIKLEELTPVVGDNVEFEIINNEKKEAVITKILERKVYIKRPKIANITQEICVLSSQDPKPDLLMLDKQLALSEYLKIKGIIVLNKIDLDQSEEFIKIANTYKEIGYKVIQTNAKQSEGIEELLKNMKSEINVFAGNSGVGKSSLINAIFKKVLTQEGEISKKNKRGKNTTTNVKLYEIDKSTYIADTPGFSTFDISEIESNRLAEYFKEFKEHIKFCEFVGCTHIKEENCGIKEAVEKGKISKERYERFCTIYNELKEKEKRKKW